MIILSLLLLIVLVLPEPALACPNHTIHAGSLVPPGPVTIVFTLLFLFAISIPLGFMGGRIARRLHAAGRIATLGLLASGLPLGGTDRAWACHGVEAVQPILEEIYAAQLEYRAQHGRYAPSFQELGMKPSSNAYSFFLPSEVLAAKASSPKEGVNLAVLPAGVVPVASADQFTVVALAFAEPDRIDVWTLDHNKKFLEWSVPAHPKAETNAPEGTPSVSQWVPGELYNRLEGPVKLMVVLLGLGIGFTLSIRTPVMVRPATS